MVFRFSTLKVITGCFFGLCMGHAQAAIVSVDWAADGTADGVASGVFTSTGLAAGNVNPTSVTLTSSFGGINGGITAEIGGLNYIDTPFALELGGVRDSNNQPFEDPFGNPLIRDEIATFDWSTGETGFVELDFGGKFLRDPILVFSFVSGLIGYDFADDANVQILSQPAQDTALVGPGNIVQGTGSTSSQDILLPIAFEGVFDSLRFSTNVLGDSANADGISVFVEETNILTEAPAAPSVVPVPASFPLLLTALAALGVAQRRKWVP